MISKHCNTPLIRLTSDAGIRLNPVYHRWVCPQCGKKFTQRRRRPAK